MLPKGSLLISRRHWSDADDTEDGFIVRPQRGILKALSGLALGFVMFKFLNWDGIELN